MSHRKEKRLRQVARAALMTAVSLDLLALAVPAGAQQGGSTATNSSTEDSSAIEEVVVTGFRASLADALDKKRDSTQIIESITAEDIGKFPDQNIAESLQRLSGVQIDRENGQGTRVRIRGLDQNIVLLNEDIFQTGLELYTLGEGNDRFTDSLEGIPSELLGGVDVIKSPTAAQVEGGLGGTVNLRTRSPFDLDGFTLAGNARLGQSSESRDNGWDPVGTLLVGDQFGERLAFIATISYDKQNLNTDVLQGQNRGNWRFTNRGDRATVPNYFAPEYRYTTDRDEERERLGASLAVAFRPNDRMELEAMWFHSNLDILTEEASVKFPFQGESPGLDTTQPFEIDSNGVLLNGTVIANSAEAISFVKNTEIQSDNFQLALNFNNGGALRGRFAGSYSKADQESGSANNDVRYTQYSVPTPDASSPSGFRASPANPSAPPNYRFVYSNNDGTLPSFDVVNNPSLYTDPNSAYFKSHWAFADNTKVDNWAARADLNFAPAFLESRKITVSGGARVAERKVDYTFGRYLADLSTLGELDGTQFGQNWTPFGYFQDGAIGFKSCELPDGTPGRPNCFQRLNSDGSVNAGRFDGSAPLLTPFLTFNAASGRVEQLNDFWSSGRVAGNAVLVQDRSQMKDALEWIKSLYPNTPFTFFPQPLETFVVEESTTSGYLMADYGGADDRLHVNIGARFIQTDLDVQQNAAALGPNGEPSRYWGTDTWNGALRDYEPVTTKRSYDDVLPSANVVFDFSEQTKLRTSAARVVARQNLFDLGRGFSTDFTRDSDPASPTFNLFLFTNGSTGNAELDPFRAWQFDASYEYYFGRQGLIAITPFYKKVDSFITQETRQVFVVDQAGGRVGPVQGPVNGEGGSIQGVELGAQMAFAWGGGFNVNYTYSDSESPTRNDIDDNLPIPGVSENAFNAQIYFERFGFQARLSYAWRDKSFFGNFQFGDTVFPDPVGDPDGTGIIRTFGRWNRDYGQLDGQIGYQVSKNFLVTLEAINITEEDQSQYLQFENLPFTFASGSRRVLLGVRGNF